MSKHWQPDRNVVPLRRGGRQWKRAGSYGAGKTVKRRFKRGRRHGGMGLGPWLAAAVAAGLAIGTFGVPAPSQFPTVIASREAARQSSLDRFAGARDDGVRATFSTCHTGGGTNCVVDGDTFYIGGEKVRIAGIDAPETHDYRCPGELALGNQATQRLREMLNSGAVTMTRIDRDRDSYGRLLRNVAVDGEDVGEALIGAAWRGNMGGGEGGGLIEFRNRYALTL